MKSKAKHDWEYRHRSVKLYCSPALWEALDELGKAQGFTRGRAVRALLESMAGEISEVAKAIAEARAGKVDQAKARLARQVGQAVLSLGDDR